MIVNSYLRKIVKESGRREITTSMIVEAEKIEQKVGMKKTAFLQNEYHGALGSMAPAYGGSVCSGLGLLGSVGQDGVGIFYY